MNINIKVMPDSAKGSTYSSTGYPTTGVYYDESSNVMYFVDKESNLTYGICSAKTFMNDGNNIQSSLDVNSILKIIAISKEPSLIKEIL